MTAWWQTLPSRMNPYLLEAGSFRVGWYGMMYVVAFLCVYLLSLYRIRKDGFPYRTEYVQDYLVQVAFGLIIGARLGYVVFYNAGYYLQHPLEIILPFRFEGGGVMYTGISGMSYHGGAIGVFLVSLWFFRKGRGDGGGSGMPGLWRFADFIVPAIPLAYTFGRLGNFINGELYGRATNVPWGMYFPSDPAGVLRHPSQLYEACFEGLFLFALLWPLRNLKSMRGMYLGAYLAGYGTVRFFIEYFREPDAHIGFVLRHFSMGQILCIGMVAVAAVAALLGRRYVVSAEDEQRGA